MPQIFIRPQDLHGPQFIVRDSEAHHLIRVLRKKPGDILSFFDGLGRQFQGRLIEVDVAQSLAKGEILQEQIRDLKRPQIHLYQGLPKGQKFDYVLEKSVELGVASVNPFLSEKNSIKLLPDQAEKKVTRWNKLVLAAVKQSGRSQIPDVEMPRPLFDWRSRFESSPTLVLWDKEKTKSLKTAAKEFSPEPAHLNIVIGPESGFTPSEMEWLLERKAILVSLGDRILRSETAGLAVLSILNYEWDLF